MKPILPFIAASVLCAASFQTRAAEPTDAQFVARPVLTARADLPQAPESRTDVVRAKGPGDRGAKLAAAQGPDALRRYVERTRTIYALHYDDYAAR